MMVGSGKHRWSFVVSLGTATWLWAGSSSALDCAADSDCPKGFTCEAQPADCGDPPPCIDGDCEPVECSSSEVKSCVSTDCTDHSDCATDMACETIVSEHCSDVACPAEADCPEVESSCETEERNYCVPRYYLPCEADADCGAGFSCVEREQCQCSGSGGSEPSPGAPDSGGSEDTPEESEPDPGSEDGTDEGEPEAQDDPEGTGSGEPADCGCEPSGEFACQLEVVECSSDSDCAAGFSCGENPEGGTCWAAPDGDSGCSEPDPAMVCLPPYLDLYEGVGYAEASGSLGTDRGAPVANVPQSEDDGESKTDAAADGNASGVSDSGGCSLGTGGRPAPFGGLALALLSGLWLRRKRGEPASFSEVPAPRGS